MNTEINDKLYKINFVYEKADALFKQKQQTGINYHINTTLHSILKKYNTEGSISIEDELDLRMILSDYRSIGNSLEKVAIYMPDDSIFSATKTSFNMTHQDGVYANMTQRAGRNMSFCWDDVKEVNGNYVIPYLRFLTEMDNLPNVLGILELDLKESEVSSLFASMENSNEGAYFIVNSNGNIVSATDKTYLGLDFANRFRITAEEMGDAGGSVNTVVAGQNLLITYKTDKETMWKYVNAVPIDTVLKKLQYLQGNTILIAVVSIAACAVIALIVANSIASPINRLALEMQKVENGDLNADYLPKSRDEIGKLGQSYVKMLKSLDNSIKQIYTEQEAKRKAELKALEYQINPHFLYNTFSLLIWQIESGDKQEAIETIKALSNIFAISISESRDLITIEEEISHVKSYIEIQMKRFKEKFEVYYDIDENLCRLYTPKILLQPVVENAMQHGIIKNKAKDGRIILHCGKCEKGVEFIIKDNGGAFTQKDADLLNAYLQDEDADAKEYGIGIKNVNKRIVLKCGREYGLEFYLENAYTCVRITIPEIRKDNANV